MKKTLLASCLILTSSVFANDFNKTLTETLKNNLKKEGNVSLVSIDELSSLGGFKFVVANVEGSDTALFASSDGKNALGLSNITLISDDDDKQIVADRVEKLRADKRVEQEKVAYEIIKTIPQDRFIHINSFDKDNKFITYIVTDPECPYCRDEMSRIVKWLRNANVKIIFAPVHGKSAYTKSAIMLKEAAKVDPNNQEEIIKILDKYYAVDANVSDSDASDAERLSVLEDAKKLFSKGVIKGVPFSFTVDKK